MENVEEKLARSLTAETTELIPYLSYLLQDLWELGTVPEDIIELISKCINMSEKYKVLDLGCGKGAVSIKIAREYSCRVRGIDLIPEFVEYAKKMAQEYKVDGLCEFYSEDINYSVTKERDYDIVVLGAVGDVLGNPEETILSLRNTVKKGGYIFIDDAYDAEGLDERYPSRDKWIEIFDKTGVRLIAEKPVTDGEMTEINKANQDCIIKRSNELKKIYPEKSELFDGYIKSQQQECDDLEGNLTGVVWLLQVI